MIIAIHDRKTSFSERWIEYCKENNIEYKLVNAYDSDIVDQLKDCDAFMWHFHHADYRDNLFAKQLMFALQQSGKTIFPDFNTAWHFDDKVGEKYLLEGLGLPVVPSYVFYNKDEALNWIENSEYPLVFKLRGGAGALNVKLVRNKAMAKKIIKKCFGCGFKVIDPWSAVKEGFRLYTKGRARIKDVIYKFLFLFYTPLTKRMLAKQKGYVYFQKFLPKNNSDIRVIVIGDKAFAIRRLVRENDFRASGSGLILYEKEQLDESCVEIAFKANSIIKSQCIAFDFVFDTDYKPYIVETSFGFSMHGYDKCPGYWTSDMQWHEGKFIPQYWQIGNVVKSLQK